jgi:hypothetical protein
MDAAVLELGWRIIAKSDPTAYNSVQVLVEPGGLEADVTSLCEL